MKPNYLVRTTVEGTLFVTETITNTHFMGKETLRIMTGLTEKEFDKAMSMYEKEKEIITQKVEFSKELGGETEFEGETLIDLITCFSFLYWLPSHQEFVNNILSHSLTTVEKAYKKTAQNLVKHDRKENVVLNS